MVAAAMELDKAVGEIFDYLENTKDKNGVPLIENTIVVLFGDHNAYYYELSDYIKDLPDTDTGAPLYRSFPRAADDTRRQQTRRKNRRRTHDR